MRETGWKAQVPFEEGLKMTIEWYKSNAAWTERVKSGEYQNFYQSNYGGRAV
jgi:dTDP-glucose 4,6-dehydratase